MPPSINLINLSDLSPSALSDYLTARDISQQNQQQHTPGSGTLSPTALPNTAIFALFGLLGAGFVISSIWFFFWASNGGFHWRKRDWEDYKTTVLRRRGPNGTLLTGASKSTRLGGGSVVGSLGSLEGDVEKGGDGVTRKETGRARGKQVKNSQDRDVRAYRHEKVAKVGGINREADGDIAPTSAGGYQQQQQQQQQRSHHSSSRREYKTTVEGSESNFSATTNESHRPLRNVYNEPPRAQPQRPIRHVPRSTNTRYTTRASTTSGEGRYTEPLDFHSRHEGGVNEGSAYGSEQTRNTKAYFHPIPGLGKSGGVPPPQSSGGYRREGGRRDSLGESDMGSRY